MSGALQPNARSLAALAVVLLGACLAPPAAADERHCSASYDMALPLDVQRETKHQFAKGPNFVLVSNTGAVAETACVFQNLARDSVLGIVEELRRSDGIDPQIVVVLTTEALACGDLFYRAIANDIRGIGYQHQDPREVFDDSPSSRLEGIAFLNDWPYWQRNVEEFAKAFNHEIGHRWSARVHVQHHGVEARALLGRQDLHWSYFLDTGGSPLEGNDWTWRGGQTFRADTPFGLRSFSQLDLYLMGILPPTSVEPFPLMKSDSQASDCLGTPLGAASPPQSCRAIDIAAQIETLDLSEVVEAEGTRSPPFDPSPRFVDTSVLVLESGNGTFDASQCDGLAKALWDRFADFERATGGKLLLRNSTTFSRTCREAFPAVSTNRESNSAGCLLVVAGPNGVAMRFFALLALTSAVLLRTRRS